MNRARLVRGFGARVAGLVGVVGLVLLMAGTSACTPGSPVVGGPVVGTVGTAPAPLPSAAPVTSSAAIWFQPQPPGVNGPFGRAGSADFLALFRPGAPWPRVLAHLQAAGFYAGWLYAASLQTLRPIVAFLRAHRIGIEIEAPALQATSRCGSGVEGYVPYGLPGGLDLRSFTLAYLRRLKVLDASVTFVKVDEPYYFGSAVSNAVLRRIAQAAGQKDAPVSCHLPVRVVARDVGQFARLVRTVYPGAAVGDTEPAGTSAYPQGTVTALDAWHDIYRSVTGKPFPFYFADVDFSDPSWPTLARQLETSTRRRGIRFGIIYTGGQHDTSDAQWVSQVITRFGEYQRQAAGRPSYVLFQSWQPHPTRCLPESNPATFTGLVNAYITATTPPAGVPSSSAGPG